MKFLFVLLFVQLAFFCSAHNKVIEEYVNRPDSSYKYSYHSTVNFTGGEAYVLNVTSQTWLTTKEVSDPIWTHWVLIIRPKRVTHFKPLVYITGSDTRMQAPTVVPRDFGLAASVAQSVVIVIYQVPHQPVSFPAEPRPRKEDGKKKNFH